MNPAEQTESAYGKRERKLRDTLACLSEGFYCCTPEGKILDYNIAFGEILQVGPDPDMSNILVQDFWQVPEERKTYLDQLMRENLIRNYQVKAVTLKGEPILVKLNSRLVRDDDTGELRIEGTLTDITRATNAERTNRLLAHAVRSISEIVTVTDMEDRLTFVNQAFLDQYGYTYEEVIGKHISMLVSPNNSPGILKEVLENSRKEGWRGELLNVTREGREFSIMLKTSQIRDENGEILGLVGIAEDISERKQAREKLQESEEQYRRLINIVPDGIVVHSGGKIVFANEAACRIMKFPSIDQLTGLTAIDFVHPDYRETVQQRIRQSILAGKPAETMEEVFITHEGNPLHVNVTAVPFQSGGVNAMLTLFTDITERKKAEEKERENFALYQSIFESTGTASMLVNDDTAIVMVNKETEIVTGFTMEELIGQKWTRFVSNESLAQMLDYHRLRWEHHELLPKKYEVRLVNKKGEVRDALLDIGLVPGTRQSIVSILDITERKQAEKEVILKNRQLEAMNAEKDKFFSIIAHDLRSPFNTFLGFTQLMAEQLNSMTLEEIGKIAVQMRQAASHLYSLLENLLDWSQMQRGLTVFFPERINMARHARQCIELFEEKARGKKILVDLQMPEELFVYADARMTDAIFRNLVSNALKFTPENGRIILEGHTNGEDSVTVSVSDTGIGMDPEMLDNLFRLDVNTSRTGTAGEPSSGLGLVLCREFVEKNNGKLKVESEAGKGSTFTFTLPLDDDRII